MSKESLTSVFVPIDKQIGDAVNELIWPDINKIAEERRDSLGKSVHEKIVRMVGIDFIMTLGNELGYGGVVIESSGRKFQVLDPLKRNDEERLANWSSQMNWAENVFRFPEKWKEGDKFRAKIILNMNRTIRIAEQLEEFIKPSVPKSTV